MRLPRTRPRHAVGFATIAAGIAFGAATLGAPRLALAIGVLAVAAALSVLSHLVNLEDTRS